METFLSEIAQKIIKENPNGLDHVTVVFNNWRPGLFLREELAKQLQNEAFFLPEIIGIDDLVQRLGGKEIIPNEFLLFGLYTIHCQLEQNKRTFEEFIPIGEIMLNDFSDIDLYRIDAKQIFSNLRDIKAIERWNLNRTEPSDMQKQYLEFYENLFKYYSMLREKLAEKHQAYHGMAYRDVAEHIDSKIQAIQDRQFYFVGFNVLSECENAIIKEFINTGRGQFITDGDAYYFDASKDEPKEAGYFLHKLKNSYPNIGGYPNHFTQGEKDIAVVNCPGNILQAKYAGTVLENLCKNTEKNREILELKDTAIVLADEKLLLPTLNTLPAEVMANITMGFPYTHSSAHELMMKLIELHKGTRKGQFRLNDAIGILADNFIIHIHGISDIRAKIAKQTRNGGISYATKKKIGELAEEVDGSVLDLLFQTPDPIVEGILAQGEEIVRQIVATEEANKDNMERESLNTLLQTILYIKELQETHHYIDNINTLEKIYLHIAQKRRVPLRGEPLNGLQILGMLETRNVDFKRVILLSANEGILPSGKRNSTLIPYDIKRNFHLPTYTEHDAVYAYHFYRLIQRAEEVHLVYNSETESSGKGEASRFILQLMNEMKYPNIKIHQIAVSANMQQVAESKEIVGKKDEYVWKRLNEISKKGFSPTAFSKYAKCPYQFYMQNIMGFWNEDESSDELQNNELGNIIHDTLKGIYNNCIGKLITKNFLEEKIGMVDQLVEKQMQETFKDGRTATEGMNHFLLDVAKVQVKNLLSKELKQIQEGHTIKVLHNELPLERNLTISVKDKEWKIKIAGRADRIDMFDGVLRIIDYKTGTVKDDSIKFTQTKLTNKNITDKWFQVLAYSWMYQGDGRIQAGIYPLRYLNADFKPAQWEKNSFIDAEHIGVFDQCLRNLVTEILDPDVDFYKTDKSSNCNNYCPFYKSCKKISQ